MKKRIDSSSEISLLYPQSQEKCAPSSWGETAVEDLEVERLAWALAIQNEYQDAIKCVLLELCREPDTLLYRQEILQDFQANPKLAAGLEKLLTHLAKLRDYEESRFERTPLRETLSRLSELNTYATCVQDMQSLLTEQKDIVQSRGLKALLLWAETTAADEVFQSLEKELPELLSKLSGFPSVSIGVNLDSQLRPIEATLLAIHEKPFKGGKLLDKVMGHRAGKKPNQGIGPLHSVPAKHVEGLNAIMVRVPERVDPMLVPLFRDLYEMLKWLVAPINETLKQFAEINIRYLISLETEIAFYLGATRLADRLKAAGMPVCLPKALPAEARAGQVKQMFNIFLAMRFMEDFPDQVISSRIILNDVDFGPEGRIFVLTGPNLGGKTVYTQGVGAVQVLFQAGLFVPAEEASISPVDGIHTHFARLEKSDSGMGRLGEEAQRLNSIFQSITEASLVLMNESLASTSPGESLYLARDVVRALRLYGARAIFATHLHELADSVDVINTEVEGDSRLISLVAGIEEPKNGDANNVDAIIPRTYKIKPGPPLGSSYARGIASRYGISYGQLEELWKGKK